MTLRNVLKILIFTCLKMITLGQQSSLFVFRIYRDFFTEIECNIEKLFQVKGKC